MDVKFSLVFIRHKDSSHIKTESSRKLSIFNFHWTKTFYQNNLNKITFFFTLFKGYIVISYTKENFFWELEKTNVKFHKMTSYKWNFQNFTCVFTIVVKFDIYFPGLPWEIVFGVFTDNKFSKIQLVVYYQCCIVIGWATTRLYVIA